MTKSRLPTIQQIRKAFPFGRKVTSKHDGKCGVVVGYHVRSVLVDFGGGARDHFFAHQLSKGWKSR